MSINIRYPNITGLSDREQLVQVKGYLYQLVDQLNYALPTIGAGVEKKVATSQEEGSHTVQGGDVSYYELRSLIVQQLQKVDRAIDQLEKDKESGKFDGKTPEKGVDYFTPEDVNAIANNAANKIRFILDENGNLYYEVEEE